MPARTSYEPGTPSWVDLASPDLEASAAFYSSLFGWDAVDQGADAGHYHMFEQGGVPLAGAGPIMMEGQPPAWTSYISVTDADASIAKVKAAGGMVFVEPMDVLDVGRMSVFADPTGAAAAVWQPRRHIGAGLVNEPGALAWNELATRDVPAATAFYAEVFGWEAETADMGGMEYTNWKLSGNQIGGMMAMPAEVPPEVPSHWLAYFGTADCDATVAAATAGGSTLMVGPVDIPPGRFAVLADPSGAMFGVIALAAT
ncbi:MAG: VOC family protein [Acidimicrobiales bacterium]|jgi:predicted enzyme related to lactoylglutathione lyase